jgi:hypothetical protein
VDEIDRALGIWRVDVMVASTSLLTLTRNPTYRRLAGAKDRHPQRVTGTTHDTVMPVVPLVTDLCRQMNTLLDLLDRAEAARMSLSPQNPSEESLRLLEHLLTDTGSPLFHEPIVVQCSGLLNQRAGGRAVVVSRLLEAMATTFEVAHEAVRLVDGAWSQWEPVVQQCEREIEVLRQQAERLNVAGAHEMTRLQRCFCELRSRVHTDPLSVPEDAESHMRRAMELLQRHLRDLEQQRHRIEVGLTRAQEMLGRMAATQALSRTMGPGDQEPARVLSEPLADLAQWLERLQAHFSAGHWQAAGIGLDRWLKTALAHSAME